MPGPLTLLRGLGILILLPIWLAFALVNFVIAYLNMFVGIAVIDMIPESHRTPEMVNTLHSLTERSMWICPQCSRRRSGT